MEQAQLYSTVEQAQLYSTVEQAQLYSTVEQAQLYSSTVEQAQLYSSTVEQAQLYSSTVEQAQLECGGACIAFPFSACSLLLHCLWCVCENSARILKHTLSLSLSLISLGTTLDVLGVRSRVVTTPTKYGII